MKIEAKAPFTTLASTFVVLPVDNIDTDQIIPARFLKVTDKKGLGDSVFCDWRRLPDGSVNVDFPLNRPDAAGAQILVTGVNFGCGSSREHAPWALVGWGLRAIVAPSFADIFKQNAMKNGLLPVAVDAAFHARLVEARRANPGARIAVDLPAQTVALEGQTPVRFEIDPFAKECLVHGIDELGYLLERAPDIERYEARLV
ncbi:MAG TPA: 3-isopropylmalate dehydratase small subunit [Polyangiaceae bacterium]|jgi:3-isopropylmalate/(R)-2-methylmalate dehydratase small subunit|nr:3-isopropylmalate dehydratase small subunit [Polyangiaceae bacterium]